MIFSDFSDISADLKGPKVNINYTMDDVVRGFYFGATCQSNK